MSASYDPNHVTKLSELYSFLTGIWTKCKNMFAAKSDLSTVATSGSYNDLSDKPTIPAAQVQSDWNQSDNTQVDFIKNKPNIPTVPTTDQTYNASSTNPQSGTAVAGAIAGVRQVPASTSVDSGKVLKVDPNGTPEWDTAPSGLPASTSADEGKLLGVNSSGNPEWQAAPTFTQEQADWTEADSNDPAYIKNKPVEQTLVAGTNITITEANNQVTIGASFTQAQADWNQSDNTAADYIKNKPSIPAAQVQSDWSQSDNTQVDFIKNKPQNLVQDAPSDGNEYVRKNGTWTAKETVLYSGARSANAALSENPTNFEYLRVTLQYDTSEPKVIIPIDSTLGTRVVSYIKGINTWTTYLQLTLSASALTTDNSKSMSYDGINTNTASIVAVTLDSTEDIGSIVKVVGINRIANN